MPFLKGLVAEFFLDFRIQVVFDKVDFSQKSILLFSRNFFDVRFYQTILFFHHIFSMKFPCFCKFESGPQRHSSSLFLDKIRIWWVYLDKFHCDYHRLNWKPQNRKISKKSKYAIFLHGFPFLPSKPEFGIFRTYSIVSGSRFYAFWISETAHPPHTTRIFRKSPLSQCLQYFSFYFIHDYTKIEL